MTAKSLLTGASLAFAGRALLGRVLLAKFTADVQRLNAGDHSGLLAAYADDAVLRFTVGEHRFAGEWRGKDEIARFMENFAAAGLQGEIEQIAMSGPPWAMTLWAKFSDRAASPADGTELYANRTVLVLRTRWGKIAVHEDFYFDTASIAEFDRRLTELGIAPVPKSG